jgi:hypothetical protein
MMQLTTTRKPWMKMRNYWLILKGLIIMQGYVVITVVLLLKATSLIRPADFRFTECVDYNYIALSKRHLW